MSEISEFPVLHQEGSLPTFNINIENRAENIEGFYGHNDCDTKKKSFLLQFFFKQKSHIMSSRFKLV